MSKIKIGLVQMSCTSNKDENLAKAIGKVRECAAKGAQIICLQELFTSLYFCDEENYDNFKLAEPVPGPSSEALCKVADQAGVVIIASLFEKRTHGIYHNTTVVLDADRSYLVKYRKMKFWGGSFVSNPFGTILTQASHEKEEVIVQEIDTDKTDSYRTHWPFLRDRRIDSYQPITERFIDTPNP